MKMLTNSHTPIAIFETWPISQEYKYWASRVKPEYYPDIDKEKIISFRSWINKLPDRQTERLALEISKLCKLPGFNLDWFREFLIHPDTGSSQDRMLLLFGLAVYESWTTLYQQKVLSWLYIPSLSKNQSFGWNLYLHLVEAGFSQFPGEFLFSPNSSRTEIIENTIREAFTQDTALVIAISREVLFLQQHNLSTIIEE